MTTFVLGLAALTGAAISGILWIAGRIERVMIRNGRPRDELGTPFWENRP
jgi:hypothetical protein